MSEPNPTFRVSTGLLDPKHVRAFGGPYPLWTYLWCLDHQTDSAGRVLGGSVVRQSQIAKGLGISRTTVGGHLVLLARKRYLTVTAVRGRGVVIVVLAQKKFRLDRTVEGDGRTSRWVTAGRAPGDGRTNRGDGRTSTPSPPRSRDLGSCSYTPEVTPEKRQGHAPAFSNHENSSRPPDRATWLTLMAEMRERNPAAYDHLLRSWGYGPDQRRAFEGELQLHSQTATRRPAKP